MKNIVLYGAGGLAREVANMIEIINMWKGNKYNLLGFLDDNILAGTVINGYVVLGGREWILENKDIYCTCAIADISSRKKIHDFLETNNVKLETIIAPDVYVPSSTVIGKDCIITGLSLLSVNMVIEDAVFINSRVSLGHDVHIGKYTCIMPGASISGCCDIGEQVMIGGHAYVIPGKKIGDNAIVAAGSIVFNNVKAGTTVLGNPAKRIRALEGN